MPLVLVVEDDVEIAESVREVLEDEGHTVIHASHGREAMQLLAAEARPCIILLDLMMPVMTGWEVLDALKLDLIKATIPVIVMSAAPDAKARLAAQAVIRKPYDIDHLVTVVERYCGAAGRPALLA